MIDVVLIDGTRDGVEQISDALARYHDLHAIHIISHGVDGAVDLGSTLLTSKAYLADKDAAAPDVLIADTPFVEGAVAAAVTASTGATLTGYPVNW